MKAKPLTTSDPKLHLIEPDIDRDAPLSVKWLEGAQGIATLLMMGVPEPDIKPTSLSVEQERISDFITRKNQLNWMIEYKGTVVGSIWIDLEPTQYIPAPTLSMMIGDPEVRGGDIGFKAFEAVRDYLRDGGESKIYARHFTSNMVSQHLTARAGFTTIGDVYADKDGLMWQNAELVLE